MKKIETIMGMFFSLTGLLGLICCIYCFIVLIGAKSNQPTYFLDKTTAVVVSGSMVPTLNVDDHVLIERVDSSDDLIIGEIYIYKKGDMYIIHRLVREYYDETLNEVLYIFKGDNNRDYDYPVPRRYVVARAIRLTRLKTSLPSTVGLVSLSVFALSVVGLKVLRNRKKTLTLKKI